MDSSYLRKNLNYLLNNKIITSAELLKLTNHTSTGLVAMWKNGERVMKTKDVIKLANHLNITIDDLVNKDISTNKKVSTISEVKDSINNLPPEDMNNDGKDTLIKMVDTLHNLSKNNKGGDDL